MDSVTTYVTGSGGSAIPIGFLSPQAEKQNHPQELLSRISFRNEEWETVYNCPNFLISSLGRMFDLVLNAIHRPVLYDRYLETNIPKCKHRLLHRLVAHHFIPNPHNKPWVCHKNGWRKDNRVENLYWGDAKDNGADTKAHSHWRSALRDSMSDNEFIRLTHLSSEILAHFYKVPVEEIDRIRGIGIAA